MVARVRGGGMVEGGEQERDGIEKGAREGVGFFRQPWYGAKFRVWFGRVRV